MVFNEILKSLYYPIFMVGKILAKLIKGISLY